MTGAEFDEKTNLWTVHTDKIRKTVIDQAVADRLMPKGHHYGCKRQPLDTNYYKTFNKPKAFLPYLDPEGVGGYTKRCAEIAAKGYEGFALS